MPMTTASAHSTASPKDPTVLWPCSKRKLSWGNYQHSGRARPRRAKTRTRLCRGACAQSQGAAAALGAHRLDGSTRSIQYRHGSPAGSRCSGRHVRVSLLPWRVLRPCCAGQLDSPPQANSSRWGSCLSNLGGKRPRGLPRPRGRYLGHVLAGSPAHGADGQEEEERAG